MHIQCTKKLLDFIKPKITIKGTDDDFYAWHANYTIINRKKFLVLMNDLTKFTIAIYGVKKIDFKNINAWLFTAVFNAMTASGFSSVDIMKYLEGMPDEVTYNKTKNRTLVARLNKAVEEAYWCFIDEGFFIDMFDQPHISRFCNNTLVGAGDNKNYFVPKEKFKEYIDLL